MGRCISAIRPIPTSEISRFVAVTKVRASIRSEFHVSVRMLFPAASTMMRWNLTSLETTAPTSPRAAASCIAARAASKSPSPSLRRPEAIRPAVSSSAALTGYISTSSRGSTSRTRAPL